MSTEATTKLMTADEFADWVMRDENRSRRLELVRGKVVEMSRPGDRHCVICGNVAWVLNNYVRQRRKGRVLTNDPGIVTERDPDTVRGPDLVFFDEHRRYDELNPKWPEGVPTLAVEVVSPSDRIGKITRRVNELLRAGIRLIWLIDPEARDVTVFRKDHNEYVVEHGQELTGDEVLPDLRCAVADFFYAAEAEKPE
jgi:Uma2 family endonuclease